MRETGVRRCPSRAERFQASSPRSLGAAPTGRPGGTHPRRSPRNSATGPGTMRDCRALTGCGSQGDRGGAELRARRRRRCSAPLRSGPLAVCQWELSGRLGWRPRRRGRGRPWETELRLGRLTIAPPPAGQSKTADTEAGRSDLSWSATAGARWVPGLHPRLGRAAGRSADLVHSRAAFPQSSGGAACGERGRQRRRGVPSNSQGAPNKAALGGPSGLRLLPQ